MTSRPQQSVLYLEDGAVHALCMQAIFQFRPSLTFTIATTCERAIVRAVGLNPSLLLLDIHLPDGSGAELLGRLRGVEGCQAAPAVAVTSDTGFRIEGTGFSEMWIKPLEVRATLAALDRVLTSRGSATSKPGGGWL